jgi:cytidine deaminase
MQITEAHRVELVRRAVEARRHAYAPYSKYAVGAALLGKAGQIFSGANVENAAYPTGMCAERTALFHAVSEGEREFAAIAVVTENAGSPCGACRQALSEFGLGTVVLLADAAGRIQSETTIEALLPHAFGPGHLPRGG